MFITNYLPRGRGGVYLWISMISTPVFAADPPPGADRPDRLAPITVVGDHLERVERPGSAHVVTGEEIRAQNYDDINRALRRVPGVYLREEDGFGIFPNISIRGVDTTRSAKVTVMEDGVLIAPAPYSAPAAYFSPGTGRMSSIEVLKGSSQIKYGPHITGGVLNYQSTLIPVTGRAFLRSTYGEFGDFRVHGFVGDTLDTGVGRFGYLLEGFVRDNEGFKTIDTTPDFRDGGNTGFRRVEPMVKFSFEPDTALYQHFEFKFGHTDMDANETYLGLLDEDFRADPFRRYSASRFDKITTEQFRSHLRHFIALTDDLDLTTTVYYTKFSRNWFKLHDIRNVPGVGNLSLGPAVGGAGEGAGLGCVRGQLDCTLRVRNNNRNYYARGVESIANYHFETGALDHLVTGGIRYHEDEERRFQRDELFFQNDDGVILGHDPGVPGNAGDRLQRADALALYLQDRIRLGRWQFTPGIRYERVDFDHQDFDAPEFTGKKTLNLFAGGMGVVYDWNDQWKLFGGIHRGFSPPSPRGVVKDGLREETSIAYELGARFRGLEGALMAEVVGFLTQFDDLIVIDNIGGAGLGITENFGKVDSSGVEVSASFDPGIANGWGFNNPYFLAFTYTNAEQRTDAASTDPESIFSFGERGNKVPYIPEFTLTVGTGLEFTHGGLNLQASYVDETFTSANNVSVPVDGEGNPDARFGKTDSFWLVDLQGHYQVTRGARVLAGVHNLLDEKYLASRQPHGPRPGLPRMAYVGFELDLGF
jgi:Fe(3+) dicitrate transport protein